MGEKGARRTRGSKIGEHGRRWKRMVGAYEDKRRRKGKNEEEEPLLQPFAELRNPHRLGLAAECARRSAPAPRDQWRRRGVASMGVESRRALWLCSSGGRPLQNPGWPFRVAVILLLTLGARSTLAADQSRARWRRQCFRGGHGHEDRQGGVSRGVQPSAGRRLGRDLVSNAAGPGMPGVTCFVPLAAAAHLCFFSSSNPKGDFQIRRLYHCPRRSGSGLPALHPAVHR